VDSAIKGWAVSVATRIGRSLAGGEKYPPSEKELAAARRTAGDMLLAELEEVLSEASKLPECDGAFKTTRRRSTLVVTKNDFSTVVAISSKGVSLRSDCFLYEIQDISDLRFNGHRGVWEGLHSEPALLIVLDALAGHMVLQMLQPPTPMPPVTRFTGEPRANPFIGGKKTRSDP
jgi:hypothetical protein